MAPLVFLSFLTRASTAFSAHFSSSSPCFHPSSRFTAGEAKENNDPRLMAIDQAQMPILGMNLLKEYFMTLTIIF